MSTRAIYTFSETGTDAVFHVYKHHDGYPSGALATIRNAFRYFAWQLPRFEADEAAASFVAACKADDLITIATADRQTADYARSYLPGGLYRQHAGGDCRLLPSGRWHDIAPKGIEYRYLITKPVGNKPVGVEWYSVSCDWNSDQWMQRKIGGSLLSTLVNMDDRDFEAFANAADAKPVKRLMPVA